MSKRSFNTIYVKRGISEDVLPDVTVESISTHSFNKNARSYSRKSKTGNMSKSERMT